MAKIYKVTTYIVDGDEVYSSAEAWLEDALNFTEDVYSPVPAECQTVEFEWDDGLAINDVNCTRGECERHFTVTEGGENK